MGLINPVTNVLVHKKRTDFENKDRELICSVKYLYSKISYRELSIVTYITASELEPLVNDRVNHEEERNARKFKTFSKQDYTDGGSGQQNFLNDESKVALLNGTNSDKDSWYQEVIELRKKANEYKVTVSCKLN